MQPFDALTIRAVLEEAKPLVVNRKVDRVFQLGRDDIVIALRSRAGMVNLFLSAQASFGRICLVKSHSGQETERGNTSRHTSQSAFALSLRKHLMAATLVGVEQQFGERVVDFVFSTVDEVGGTSLKVLTAEIMGRHSNLIFWDRQSEKIIAASHVVTRDMSRQREVAPGLRYERPPGQEKANLFKVEKEDFEKALDALISGSPAESAAETRLESERRGDTAGSTTNLAVLTSPPQQLVTVEQWLIHSYTGLGRHLAEELVTYAQVESPVAKAINDPELKSKLWRTIEELRQVTAYRPAMRKDLTRYTVISWWPDAEDKSTWTAFPAVNDLMEEYYRAVEAKEHYQQMRERMRQELNSDIEKLTTRIDCTGDQLAQRANFNDFKKWGDLILANLNNIGAGQESLQCADLFSGEGESTGTITIPLSANLSASQNAQNYYRQFSKNRARQNAAQIARQEAQGRLQRAREQMAQLEKAQTIDELRQLKDSWLGRKPKEIQPRDRGREPGKNKKSRLMSLMSSDGWTIYVGRNRNENDHLIGRMAQPQDLWLHILGQGGAHVLIKVPSGKQDPPMNTIREAAQVAARLSKAVSGSKVRVVYTQCRYVKKLPREAAGTVKYENEKTIEVDTALPMPKCMKQLFS